MATTHLSVRAAVVLTSLLGALPALAAMPLVPEMQKNLRAIESAIFRGEVDTLRMGYQEQAKNRPSDLELRIYLAWCGMPSDDTWNQLKAINTIHPENPWVHQGMARVYTKWKTRDQAVIEYNTAISVNRQFYPAMVGLGTLDRLAGKQDEAQAHYREALALQDDAEAHAGLGLSFAAQGKAAEAKAELTKAIALWPDQPEVLLTLGRLAHEAKDFKGAVPHLAKLAELSPRDRDAHKVLADARYELGEKEGAAAEYERYLKLGGLDLDILKRVVNLYRESGKPEGEERALQQLSTLEKSAFEHPLRLGEIAEARGALEDAEAQLLEAVSRAPNIGGLRMKLAALQQKREELREALESFREAKRLGGAGTEDAESQAAVLSKKFKLPAKPAKGSVDKIYSQASAGLNTFYIERLAAAPSLGGTLKYRVRVDKTGKVLGVDSLEDTVGDPLISAHVYFALADAEYPKQKREPVFEFELKPPRSKGKK
jgi:tetratricopeptide (TPR) repeat protein